MKKLLVILLLLFATVCVADTTGNDNWYMYPNPARDHITLKALDGFLAPWVRIYDMTGNMVHEMDMPYDNPNIIVDLPDGMYTVKTFHDQAEPIQTFVIGKP